MNISKNYWAGIGQALLRDTLYLLILTFGLFVIGEILLPGFVASKISLLGLILLIALNMWLIQKPPMPNTSSKKAPTLSRFTKAVLILFGGVLLLTSLYTYSIFGLSSLFLLTIAALFLLYTFYFSS